jgi:hypothetical protein
MHATPTTDFGIVLDGTVGLELDVGEVIRLYALMRGWRGRIDATGRVCHGAPQRRRSRSR